MENTLVDESQRQSKEYGSASKPRHEKYSGMIICGMVCVRMRVEIHRSFPGLSQSEISSVSLPVYCIPVSK